MFFSCSPYLFLSHLPLINSLVNTSESEGSTNTAETLEAIYSSKQGEIYTGHGDVSFTAAVKNAGCQTLKHNTQHFCFGSVRHHKGFQKEQLK